MFKSYHILVGFFFGFLVVIKIISFLFKLIQTLPKALENFLPNSFFGPPPSLSSCPTPGQNELGLQGCMT